MSSAIKLENSSSPSFRGEAPHAENQLVAMCMIYALLNQAMGEGVKTQIDVATSLNTAQDKIRSTLETLNKNMATLQGNIQGLQDTLDKMSPYLTGLTIATMVLGVGAAAAAPAVVALQEAGMIAVASIRTVTATVTVVAKVLTGLAGMASGVASIVDGSARLEQAGCTQELAPVNSDNSLAMAVQKNYQATNKTVVDQIAESMSRMTSLAQSIAKDMRAINEGLREANRNVLQGVLGNYK